MTCVCLINLIKPYESHLLPQVVDDALVFAVVSEVGAALLQGLLDLDLQLVVGLLQVPHRLQVVCQAVVQVLHSELLVPHDVCAVPAHLDAAGEAPRSRGHPSSQRGAHAGGHADAAPPGTSVDAGGPVDRQGGAGD